MADYEYELIVIGGGPAGEKGAAQAAYFRHKTVLIEAEAELGGACINWGTLASKTLRESALFLSGFRTRQLGEGLDVQFKADITLASFMHRKNLVQRREQERAARNLAAPWHQIDRITGRARIIDPHTVEVTAVDGSVRKVSGKIILVATGSTPARPKNVRFNADDIFDATTVLEMKRLPKSMVVIGGGVIGSEYACLFNALGVKTTLVHPKPRALDSLLDGEIGELFMNRMRRDGIELCMNESLPDANENQVAVISDGGQVKVTLKSGKVLTTDAALYALGRDGNTKDLGLKELGIPVNQYGLVMRKGPDPKRESPDGFDPITYRTRVPSIFVAGDVIGAPALASTSMEQGRLAMCHAFGLLYKTKLAPILPAGIYTIPEISQVGKTEEDCVREKIPYVVGKDKYGNHGRGQIIGDTEGMIKLIFESPSGKLLGVHVIGEIASELVHIGLACLSFGGDIEFFIHTVFNYPTLGDVYKYAAYNALGKLNAAREAAAQAARAQVAAAG
ncbi:MAG TPA: Si-specific NAD(P)(+) transhydrogenase [Tepidisphaeraceae bacterium]|nr:Si-specific NAD(P)(+) transhydrogenase [Tepidisphaeraceae bacterium]